MTRPERNLGPLELQGRVYACRNTLQFFTIPIGLFLGGFLVDRVCEPYMSHGVVQTRGRRDGDVSCFREDT